MSVSGLVTGARHEPVGSELTADAAVTDEVLAVEWAELFTDEGGTLVLNDAQLDYLVADDEADTITLADPLADAAVAGDTVYVFEGGQVKTEYVLVVDMGEGDPVLVPIPFEQRDMWPNGDYDDPVPVVLTDDLTALAEVPQRTPARDPGFIRTGGLGAKTVVYAGTAGGRRAQLDGIDGAIEAYNAANEQTVNIDGDENYMQGTIATDAPGEPRVVVGAGEAFGAPAEEVRFETGHADESTEGKVAAQVTASTAGVIVAAPVLDATQAASLTLRTHTTASGLPSDATFEAQVISISAEQDLSLAADSTVVSGSEWIFDGPVVDAEMRDGSVGTGTFRDSVDARVALGGGTSRPTFAFFMGA